MTAEPLHTLWPADDAPGQYEAGCSCGATKTGTPRELGDWGRRHDDSPRRNHIVGINHGGRRTDQPQEAP